MGQDYLPVSHIPGGGVRREVGEGTDFANQYHPRVLTTMHYVSLLVNCDGTMKAIAQSVSLLQSRKFPAIKHYAAVLDRDVLQKKHLFSRQTEVKREYLPVVRDNKNVCLWQNFN